MLKKFGMVTVGVTAGLLAVAPIASASECHDDHGSDKSHSRHHDGGDQEGTGNVQCAASSDFDGSQENGDTTGGLSSLVGPTLSGNAGQIASCNSFLNDNANNASINVLSTQGDLDD